MPSEPRIQIEARPGLPAGPAKRLEKWVNKKVPVGKPLPFPDFHDVLRCVREANDEDRLGWNEADIMEEARDLFTRCGKKLQRRRQENEWRIATARLSHNVSTLDPAEKSVDLKKKLEENKALASKKETELLNKFAEKQNQLKLVGEEIGEKEAEESPVESEDDEGNDESNSLQDKQKRKERLKRLLHEKSRKISSEKQIITTEAKEKENEVVVGEEKLECEATASETSEVTKNNDEVSLQVTNEVKGISNDTTTNTSEDGTNNEHNQVTTKDSELCDVDSDIDELHLLQKLYSENEINSSTQESDSDTPIAISDTLDSDSDNENVKIQQNYDIISIENSSYSESESPKDECENARASDALKDKRKGLLLRNAEVVLLSSTSEDKLDVNEENILLASSEEDNDVDTHLNSNEHNTCGIKLLNNDSAHSDCEVILDNGDENSLHNNIKTYEVPVITEGIDKTNKSITANNFKRNILDINRVHHELNEIISLPCNEQLQNDVKFDKLMNTLIVSNQNQHNFETDKSDSNDVIMKDISRETKDNCEIDNYKCKENNDEHNSMHVQNDNNKVKLKVAASNEVNSNHHKDNIENFNSSPNRNVIDDDDKGSSKSVNTIHTEQNFNECEVMDVNVEIAEDSITNQKTTCEDGEVINSVQCK